MSQSPSSFVLVVTLLPALLSAHHATETQDQRRGRLPPAIEMC